MAVVLFVWRGGGFFFAILFFSLRAEGFFFLVVCVCARIRVVEQSKNLKIDDIQAIKNHSSFIIQSFCAFASNLNHLLQYNHNTGEIPFFFVHIYIFFFLCSCSLVLLQKKKPKECNFIFGSFSFFTITYRYKKKGSCKLFFCYVQQKANAPFLSCNKKTIDKHKAFFFNYLTSYPTKKPLQESCSPHTR